MNLSQKIEARQAIVSVIGLGHVGLPLGVLFAEAGFRVIGIDADESRVESVNRGESFIPDVPSATLRRLVAAQNAKPLVPSGPIAGILSATTDYDVLLDADAVIVCVPTPLSKTKDPDVSYIISAANEIATRLHSGILVVLESTTYPGTTEELLLPRLQHADGQRLAVGSDTYDYRGQRHVAG